MHVRTLLSCLVTGGAIAAFGACGGPANEAPSPGSGLDGGSGGGSSGGSGIDGSVGLGSGPDGSLGASEGGCADEAMGCPCSSVGGTIACWTGPSANRNVGDCHDGTQTCQAAGEFGHWGPCVGEVLACGDAAPPMPTTVDAGPPDTGAPDASMGPPTFDSCAQLALAYLNVSFPATVCRLSATGSVQCAGTGAYETAPGSADGGTFPPNLTGARCISGGEDFFCAVTSVGGVTCWGDGSAFDPAQTPFGKFAGTQETLDIPGLTSGVVDISAGETHMCVLKSDGTVMCWGNGQGEIDTGSWTLPAAPTEVPDLGGPVISIASGDGFSCALRNDGVVLCWGNNAQGELGNGTMTDSSVPVPVKGLPLPAVGIWADQATHPCALLNDHSVWCWGTVGPTPSSTPVEFTGFSAPATAVSPGGEESMSCALLANTGIECWGSNAGDAFADPLSEDGGIFEIYPAGAGAVRMRSTDADFCAIFVDGGVSCWGMDPGIANGGSGGPAPVSGL